MNLSKVLATIIITSVLGAAGGACAQAGYYGDNGHGQMVHVAEIAEPAQKADPGAVYLCYRDEKGKSLIFKPCSYYFISSDEMSKLGTSIKKASATTTGSPTASANGLGTDCNLAAPTCELSSDLAPKGYPNSPFQLEGDCAFHQVPAQNCHWMNQRLNTQRAQQQVVYAEQPGYAPTCGIFGCVYGGYGYNRFARVYPERCYNGRCEVISGGYYGGYRKPSKTEKALVGGALVISGAVIALSH